MIPFILLWWAIPLANAGYPIAAHALLLAVLVLAAWRAWADVCAGRCACCLSEGHAVTYRVALPGRRVDYRCPDCAAVGRVPA